MWPNRKYQLGADGESYRTGMAGSIDQTSNRCRLEATASRVGFLLRHTTQPGRRYRVFAAGGQLILSEEARLMSTKLAPRGWQRIEADNPDVPDQKRFLFPVDFSAGSLGEARYVEVFAGRFDAYLRAQMDEITPNSNLGQG